MFEGIAPVHRVVGKMVTMYLAAWVSGRAAWWFLMSPSKQNNSTIIFGVSAVTALVLLAWYCAHLLDPGNEGKVLGNDMSFIATLINVALALILPSPNNVIQIQDFEVRDDSSHILEYQKRIWPDASYVMSASSYTAIGFFIMGIGVYIVRRSYLMYEVKLWLVQMVALIVVPCIALEILFYSANVNHRCRLCILSKIIIVAIILAVTIRD